MSAFRSFCAAPALALSLLLAPVPVWADSTQPAFQTGVAADSLPEKKRTMPGLYITAAEAAQLLEAGEGVLLIDVRSPEETMLIGYATPTAANIPFAMIAPGLPYDPKKDAYKMKPDPQFADKVAAFLAEDPARAAQPLLIMCRSGSRSAKAVNALAEAGIDAQLYSVIDGFEGDKDASGTRSVNGWRNAGAPWTYKVTPDLWPRPE